MGSLHSEAARCRGAAAAVWKIADQAACCGNNGMGAPSAWLLLVQSRAPQSQLMQQCERQHIPRSAVQCIGGIGPPRAVGVHGNFLGLLSSRFPLCSPGACPFMRFMDAYCMCVCCVLLLSPRLLAFFFFCPPRSFVQEIRVSAIPSNTFS
jgi:hypothetical protein